MKNIWLLIALWIVTTPLSRAGFGQSKTPPTSPTPAVTASASAAIPIAGPPPDSAGSAPDTFLEKSPLFSVEECRGLSRDIKRYRTKFLDPISLWSSQVFSGRTYHSVFYPFSGPDVVTVVTMFPNADYYLLVADQIPEYHLMKRSRSSAEDLVEFECKIVRSYSRMGFFRTHDLDGETGPRPRFLKLMAYNFALAGATILSADPADVDTNGNVAIAADGAKPKGVRFTARLANGRVVTLDYLQLDLSNGGLKRHPHTQAPMVKAMADITLLKAASHLLQESSFSVLADLLTSNKSQVLVQDETGLDIDVLAKNYQVAAYGKFTTPNKLWAKSESAKRLKRYYQDHSAAGPPPFRFGYEKAGGSALLVGTQTP